MNPSDVRDLLARALPDQPATRITRESAVSAGRRARRRWWHARSALAVAVFGVVGVGIVVPVSLSRPGGHATLGQVPGSATSAPSGPTGAASVPPSSAPASSVLPDPDFSARPGELTEMSAVLLARAHQLLPTATFGPVTVGFPGTNGGPGGSRKLYAFELADNGRGYYVAFATILVPPSSAGVFSMSMFPGPDNVKAPHRGCDNAYEPQLSCEKRTGPNGEISIETGNIQGPSTTVEYKVKMFRPDGTILQATVADTTADDVAAAQGTRPPMTTEQIVALLSVPGLTLAHS